MEVRFPNDDIINADIFDLLLTMKDIIQSIKVKEFGGTIHTKRKGQKEELLEGTSFIWAENH